MQRAAIARAPRDRSAACRRASGGGAPALRVPPGPPGPLGDPRHLRTGRGPARRRRRARDHHRGRVRPLRPCRRGGPGCHGLGGEDGTPRHQRAHRGRPAPARGRRPPLGPTVAHRRGVPGRDSSAAGCRREHPRHRAGGAHPPRDRRARPPRARDAVPKSSAAAAATKQRYTKDERGGVQEVGFRDIECPSAPAHKRSLLPPLRQAPHQLFRLEPRTAS